MLDVMLSEFEDALSLLGNSTFMKDLMREGIQLMIMMEAVVCGAVELCCTQRCF